VAKTTQALTRLDLEYVETHPEKSIGAGDLASLPFSSAWIIASVDTNKLERKKSK